MKKRNRQRGFLWLWLLLAVFLGACGGEEEKSYVYVVEEIPVPGKSKDEDSFKARDGYFYYCQGNKVYRFSVAELAENEKKTALPGREEVFAPDGEDGSLCAYTLDGDGSGYYALADLMWQTGEVRSMVLVKQQADGTEGYRLDLKEQGIGQVISMAADGAGRVFLLTDTSLYVVDEEGELAAEIPESKLNAEYHRFNGCMLEGEEGSVYYSPSPYIDVVYEVSGSDEAFRDGSFQMKRIQYPCTTGRCYSSQQGLLCAGQDDTLYRLRREESEWEEVLHYGDSNLQMQPSQMLQFSDEWMAAYYKNDDYWNEYAGSELFFLTKTDAALLPERGEAELVMAASGVTDEMNKFIAEYNRTSGCHITVRYYQGADRIDRLNAEMVSSNPPDLIVLEPATALKFSEQGMLEDLAPYLEASAVLDREDFLENILEGYTLGGRLVCIPDSFYVQTAVGRASQVGEHAGWTTEEVISFADSHPEARLFGNTTFTSVVSFFAEDILERYIDWESGECSFDGEEFRFLAAWMKEHSDGFGCGIPFAFDEIWSDAVIPEGQLLYPNDLIYGIEFLMPYELQFGEEITAIGYPTPDGRPYYVGVGKNTVGIPANSQNKEAAWQFVEAYLTRENQYFIGEMSSRRERLEKEAENKARIDYEIWDGEIVLYKAGEHEGEPVMIRKGWIPLEGESIPYYYMTQEQLDAVMEVIENADFTPRLGGLRREVISILLEELSPYIEGQKSLEECSRILQSRVQNLVQENL